MRVFLYCFLKINLEVDIKIFIKSILRHSLVGAHSIRVSMSFINVTLKHGFSTLVLLTFRPDNSVLWSYPVYYHSILGLYPLHASNTHTHVLLKPKMSPAVAKCLLRAKLAPVENHTSKPEVLKIV